MNKSTKKRLGGNSLLYKLAPFIVLVIILGVLELVTRGLGISRYVLPPPSDIIVKTIQSFPEIWPDFLFTLKIIVFGFCIAVPLGMLIAALFSQFNILVKAISPVIIWLVITPMITLIPLLLLWLGPNPDLRMIVVVVQATPIITLNTLNGFTNVETEKLELARSAGATKFQCFTKIIFMNAMPQVFTGIKLGCIFSTIGAISADFVAITKGMGFRILQYTKYVNTEQTYGCIIIIAIIGISLYSIAQAIEHRIVLWKN